ncbi:uncharacterized protein LOC133425062 [Cololabis saira]|uniref:uncharacterized protein LOC133425062 n=1 Tax=Cololabis saira TaxID=129043 RepID=UPI002AD2A274|nr:uncharacterized protein LOC133425062 [Cololabis saira]
MNNYIFFVVIFMFSCRPTTSAVSDEADPYRKLGSSFVLCSDYVAPPITSITWKHGQDIAVDWFNGMNVTCYRIFKDHCYLNTTSGCLTLSNVTPEHSGRYTPEISDKVKDPIEIKIISPVPKPTVSSDCNDEKTQCNLTCEGIITDNHGPVKSSWILGDNNVTGTKTFQITQKNQENPIGCVLENPVSRKESEHISNPLTGIRNRPISAIGIGIPLVLVVLVVVALVSYFICNKKQERQTYTEQEQSYNVENHNNEFKESAQLLKLKPTLNGTTVNSPEKNIKPDEPTGEEHELTEVTVADGNKGPDEPTGERQELPEVTGPDDNNKESEPAPAKEEEEHAAEKDQS